jgi:hypothetical protein
MTKRFICFLVLIFAVSAATLSAQGDALKVPVGTLILSNKKYPLKHALAYETQIDSEEAIAVVLSGQAVSNEQLKEARKVEKDGGDGDFKKPFLRLVFKKTGDLKNWSAAAGGTSVGRRSGTATGEFSLRDGRVVGKATQPEDRDEMIPSSFDVQFEALLLKAGDSLPESTARRGGPAANIPPTVTGLFKGNGKEAKLVYASARWTEPFSDKPSIMLVFTEKDHSKEKKPDMGAMFGKFGSALIISLHEDGSIFGCQVVHSAHQKQGFSSVGSIEATEFTYSDGKVEGELTTSGPVDTFGETWEVNLKFIAPLGEIPKEFEVAEPKATEKKVKSENSSSDDDDDDDSMIPDLNEAGIGKPKTGGLKAKELVLTKDATDVEYKDIVQHVLFNSKVDVKKVCAELAANLKAQGWTSDGPDLVNPQSSILKRKRGSASLTIFVKPAGGGSEVKIFTEGLSWE